MAKKKQTNDPKETKPEEQTCQTASNETANGEATNCEATNGEAANCEATNCETANGEAANCENANRDAAELRETKEKLLRTLAEYDNYRKRTAKEKEVLRKECIADTVEAFLPVIDNLHRAQQSLSGADAEGVELVLRQFEEIMTSLGVEEISAEGEEFDPNLHNAVMHVEDDTLGENTVAEVFSKGYRIGDRVIRHCMVKVAN